MNVSLFTSYFHFKGLTVSKQFFLTILRVMVKCTMLLATQANTSISVKTANTSISVKTANTSISVKTLLRFFVFYL